MAKMQKARRAKRTRSEVEFLQDRLVANGVAMVDGPKRKNWSVHDLENIRPLNNKQEDFFKSFFNESHICAHGSAGTGKTFIALYLALYEFLKTKEYNDIKIIRSAVSTRDVGHLPGTLEEKISLYELPYKDICQSLIKGYRASTYDDMKEVGMIKFMTTSFIRGLSWDNSIIIIDEAQNMGFHEISSILTRVGQNSRVIIIGDCVQTDLNKRHDQSGFADAIKVLQSIDDFDDIKFSKEDIVRSNFVKAWISACEDKNLA